MKTFLPHTYISEVDIDSNAIRGSLISQKIFDEIKDSEKLGNSFGKRSKDVVEFSAYSPAGEIFGWKVIEQAPNYVTKNLSYIDFSGQSNMIAIDYLESVYPRSSDGHVLISPTHELEELGIGDGNYKIRMSFRSDVVGSFENSSKLSITDISSSRTEFRAVTTSLKDSRNPNDVSLNFEYNNFIKKQVLVANLSNQLPTLLYSKSFQQKETSDEIKNKTSDYDSYIVKIEKQFILSEQGILRELDGIYENLKSFYFNLILSEYNQSISKERLNSQYIKSVDYILDNYGRFTQGENTEIKLFYKYMLIQMFDTESLDLMFSDRFDKFLVNIINFGNGISIPILKYTSYVDNNKPSNCNEVLLIKTLEPLPEYIETEHKFYISNNSYADDIIKSISIRSSTEISTYKLRGPDITTKVSTESTKQYTLKGETGLLQDDLEYAEDLFNTTGKDISDLQIDYSDLKKFVKFSSARSRLDNFVLKLTNLSKIKDKLNKNYSEINDLNKKISLGDIDESTAMSSIRILQQEYIKKLNVEYTQILKSLTPYEKFLFYEDTETAWPREVSFNLSGFSGNLFDVNCEYKLFASSKYDLDKVFKNTQSGGWKIVFDGTVGKWKLFNETLGSYIYSTTSNLNSGFTAETSDESSNHIGFENQTSNFENVYLETEYDTSSAILPPQLIPPSVDDFKKTDGYRWYTTYANEANLYDKHNDDSLKNSIPEFLVRTDENDEFITFLNMIGEQFDVLLVYIEAMSDMSYIRNSFSRGVPNQLVWFVMNSFGVNFVGREVDELSISKRFEKNRNTVWRRILNNLPYILKTSGTETSIRSLFKCYGVPDYLFQIREFGGVNYGSDDFTHDTKYKLDVYDYSLKFSQPDQYISIPIETTEQKENLSIEFRVNLDPDTFKLYQDSELFDETNSGTLPQNTGDVVSIRSILNNQDFIIGSENPRFYSKPKNSTSFKPKDWDEDDISLSWKNFREGVTFSYPKVPSGQSPSFMTIYSNEARQLDGTYDPAYTLAEVGAQETLNGRVVRLYFNKDDNHRYSKNFYIDFKFMGSVGGTHYTIQELKDGGVFIQSGGHSAIMSSENWEFGVYRDSTFLKDYGKFYFTLNNSDGILYCPENISNPIYFGKDHSYDVLLSKTKSTMETEMGIGLSVKRVVDSTISFEEMSLNLVSLYSMNLFLSSKKIFFGNKTSESFLGRLDRLRVYKTKLSNERFLNHINFNESYDIEDPTKLKESLLVKLNFDYPVDISDTTGRGSVLKNYALGYNPDIIAHNFNTTQFPYDFVGVSRREYASLPGYGAKSFNNDKIRIENQELISTLSPTSRSTKKSTDRYSVDTNTLGVYFSPTDIINREIIRFFGNFRLSDYIGDPADVGSVKYQKLESFRRIFFDNGFGNIDIQKYFNLIKSYIDPSLFENLEKIIPARTKLVSGLLIEPTILERQKLTPVKIDTHTHLDKFDKVSDKENITEYVSFNFNIGPKRNNISSFANDRGYVNKPQNEDSVVIFTADINTTTRQTSITHEYNYGRSSVGMHIDDKYRDIFSLNGCTTLNGSLYKVEKTTSTLQKASEFGGKYINYDTQLDDGIEIVGFTNKMQTANGVYEFKFRGQSGLPVFCDETRMWWVFYSTTKDSWIIASDGTSNGGKFLATGRKTNFENYTWITGNTVNYQNSSSSPEWFGTGFNNSLESDNLPDDGIDYFARVSFISSYQRFIEIDAYLSGWVNAELHGVYKGSYIKRNVLSNGEYTDKSYKSGLYRFEGNREYIYINGEFRGKMQSGWIGSADREQNLAEKTLRVVGSFGGKEHTSCQTPHYVSGEINSIVSFDNRDKIVLDFKNYNSGIQISNKKFNSLNLVKIPETLDLSANIDVKFHGDFTVKPTGFYQLNNFTNGTCVNNFSVKTLDIFNPPEVWSCETEYEISVKSSCISEAFVIGKSIKYKPSESYLEKKINDLIIRVSIVDRNPSIVDILNPGGGFVNGLVYNQLGEVESIDHDLKIKQNLINNTNSEVYEDAYKRFEKIKNESLDFCLINVYDETTDDLEFVMIGVMELKSNFKNNVYSENFFHKTKQLETETSHLFEDTDMIVDGTPHFIREIEILTGGLGYTGEEYAHMTGNQPKNWKDTWPHQIKVSDLFIIDQKTGRLLRPNYENYLFTGMHWRNDKTLTFNQVPSIVIDSPDENSDYINRSNANVRCITGLPTPKISQTIKLKSLGNLKLGDTIGKPLHKEDDQSAYFKTKSNIKYDSGSIHTKNVLVQTNDRASGTLERPTDILILTRNSLSEFDFYPIISDANTMRTDVCGDSLPVGADTYDIQILNFEDDTITYKEGGNVSNLFFGIFNKQEYELVSNEVVDPIKTDDLIKNYENRVSSGYVSISGFYGSVSTANGVYDIQYDVSYCGEDTISIPTYQNRNKDWLLLFDVEYDKWILRKIDDKKIYIISNTKYLEDGFDASRDNNLGFFGGDEIYIKEGWQADINGAVYNKVNNIVGYKFQSAYVSVNNKFKIVPNLKFFDIINDKIGTFLIWKIRVKSRKDSSKIFEMPIVYINTDVTDDTFLIKYGNVENKLKELKIIQTQEKSGCNLIEQQTVSWKPLIYENNKGVFADDVNIRTYGTTFLDGVSFGKTPSDSEFVGVYNLVADKLLNKHNFQLKYSHIDKNWIIADGFQTPVLFRSTQHPPSGTYKTDTKNILGTIEYELFKNKKEISLSVGGFYDVYDQANGSYRMTGYLETGEYLFKNENGWLFFYDNKKQRWSIKNSIKHETLSISLNKQIQEVGVYESKTSLLKMFINFKLKFEFNDVRQFIHVDTSSMKLSGSTGNYRINPQSGDTKVPTDVDLETKFTCTSLSKTNNYNYTIPASAFRQITNYSIYDGLLVNIGSVIDNELKSDILGVSFGLSNTKNSNARTSSYKINLTDSVDENKNIFVDNFYSNNWHRNKHYTAGDVVYFNKKMYRCKKHIPSSRVVYPDRDYERDVFWQLLDTKYYTDIKVSCNINIKKRNYEIETIESTHSRQINQKFSKEFTTNAEIERGIPVPVLLNNKKSYVIQKKYRPYELANIGTTDDVLERGTLDVHTYKTTPRRLKRISVNDETTTINTDGLLCQKPAIVRTPNVRVGSDVQFKDSFWFNEDKRRSDNTNNSDVVYTKPSEDSVISLNFEKFIGIESISLNIEGFVGEVARFANGAYTQLTRKFNDYSVYKNSNDWYLYKEDTHWVLTNSKTFHGTDVVGDNIQWTTSSTDMLNTEIDGNFGSSDEFVEEVATVYVNYTDAPTPSPTNTPTPTETPTQTTTPSDGESPITPVPLLPTPTPIPSAQPTPTPTPSQKPEPPIDESVFGFVLDEFAITTKKYNLSETPNEVMDVIKEEIGRAGYDVVEVASVEMLLENRFILNNIPTEIKTFGVMVKRYNNLESETLSFGDLTKYGWDSSNKLSNGRFRPFYLSRSSAGRKHLYNDKNLFIDSQFYLKSWPALRPVMVRLKTIVTRVGAITASTGLHDSITISWIPSPDAQYVRIETRHDTESDWSTLADNVSQTYATYGYVDRKSPTGKDIHYRIISVGKNNKTATSDTAIGWRLMKPLRVESPSATRGLYFDKIEIRWDSPKQTSKYNKTQSYSILRSKTNNFRNYSGYKTIASELTETSYTDTDEELVSGETYFYRIISHNLVTDNYTTTEYESGLVSSASFTGYTGSFNRGIST